MDIVYRSQFLYHRVLWTVIMSTLPAFLQKSRRMSDSDSSSSSSDEECVPPHHHHHRQRHPHRHVAAEAAAANQKLTELANLNNAVPAMPVSSTLQQVQQQYKQAAPRPITSRPVTGPIFARGARIDPVLEKKPNELRGREPSTVTYGDTQYVPFRELRSQKDKGQVLEFAWGSGVKYPEYSNPVDASKEMLDLGAIDVFCGSGYIFQENDLGLPFLVTLPNIPLAKGPASRILNPRTVTAETPHGQFAVVVNSGEKKPISRILSDPTLQFIEDHPGQKFADQKNFIYPSGANKDISHVTMNPVPAAVKFYNELPEVQAKPELMITKDKADAMGTCYANTKLAEKAVAMCECIDRDIVYSDFTHPENFVVQFEMPHVNVRKGSTTETQQVPMAKAYMHSKLFQELALSKFASNNPTKLNDNLIDKLDAGIKIRYEVKLPFYKVHPNFSYKDAPAS